MLWGRVLLASVHVLRHPAALPWRELSANMYHAGVSALGITALVGLLIGVVLSYLSSQQLARYGANVLIVDLLGISILRELGPLLAAIPGDQLAAALSDLQQAGFDEAAVIGRVHT